MRPPLAPVLFVLLVAAAPADGRATDPGPVPTPAAAPTPAPIPIPAAGPHADAAGEESRPLAVFGRIRGTVYDAARAPRPGIMVQLTSRDRRALLRVTGTDEKGQYLFQDLPAGRYDIEAGAEGLPHERKEGIEVRPPFQNLVDFRLGSAPAGGAVPGRPPAGGPGPDAGAPSAAGGAVTVRGELLDQSRRPVDEASVTFAPIGGGRAYQAFSGEDGRFAIEGVPAGRYRVRVASPGHIGLSLPGVTVLPEVGLDLSLTLVDHPLDDKGRRDALLPREEPRPAPSPSPAGAVTPAGGAAGLAPHAG